MAHALAALPLTSAALAAGRISYSKVRARSRVATAANEDFFLGVAEYGTASHLETMVGLVKRGLAVDDASRLAAMVENCTCDWYHDACFFRHWGMLVLHARLLPDDGARLVAAVRTLEASDRSVPLAARRASALAMVAEAACAPNTGGVSVPEIVVHVQAAAASTDGAPGETSAHIEDAVAISTTTAERLCCDAAVVPMLETQDGELRSIGRRSRTIPRAIRRAMNARDQGCRFPGCTHTRILHGHHIRHWAQQGETSLENLATLCSYHHMLVHEGGFSIIRTASGDIEWFTPRVGRIESAAPTRHGDVTAIIETNSSLGLRVSAATCDSKWGGPLGMACPRITNWSSPPSSCGPMLRLRVRRHQPEAHQRELKRDSRLP